MSRVVVVLPLTPLVAGETFAVRDWPLHVTIVPPFRTDAAPAEVADAIRSATSSQGPLAVVAGGRELFGRRHDVPVTVLHENEELTQLHRRLLDAMRPLAVSPDERAFTVDRFRPHVTTKRHGGAHEGARYSLSQIAVVDMAPRSSPGGRIVLAVVDLGNPEAEGD